MLITRRQFLTYSAATLLIGSSATLGYSVLVEPYWLEFPQLIMSIQNLPSHLEGKTLMQISDMHIGQGVSDDYLIDSLRQAGLLNPDFVVYTGDFVSYDDRSYDQIDKIMPFGPKGKLATVASLGNHDYGRGWQEVDVADAIASSLEDKGIRVLLNEVEDFSGLKIGGMEDFWSPRYFPRQVTEKIAKGEPSVVLCHNPDGADSDGWGDYQGWILSGHTHGGQVKPPFLPAPILAVSNRRYAAGVVDLYDGRMLYINKGLGHLLPLRFNVRPEITLFHLTRA
jgi:predicted MPP superfamily phosphohydrolase